LPTAAISPHAAHRKLAAASGEPDELHAARAELVRLQTYIDVPLDHMQAFTETQMHMLENWKRSTQAKLAEARDSETRRAS
jgi:hypothetical protein